MWRKISRRRSYSYTEFGTNEKGVSVSATETLYGNEKVTESDPYRDAEWAEANKSERTGIEETDIPTIILAEASSAREGVKLLLDIYENYGCVAASGVFVCDKDEVWYVENCSGTQYVAIKLNNNMIFLEPNMAVIGRVDLDDENVIASKDLIAVAKKAGTFVGDEAKNIIDFRASYARISEKMDQRMIDGLNYLNATYKYDSDALVADNTKFTISTLTRATSSSRSTPTSRPTASSTRTMCSATTSFPPSARPATRRSRSSSSSRIVRSRLRPWAGSASATCPTTCLSRTIPC